MWGKLSFCTRDTSGLVKKQLEFELALRTSSSVSKFYLLWESLCNLPGSKIYLSRTTRQQFSQALHCQGENKGTCRCMR